MGIYSTQENYYRFHSRIYNQTRWAILFGRKKLWRYLPELPDSAKILEIGCGTGFHLKKLAERYPGADITGIDPSEAMLDIASSSLNTGQVQLLLGNYPAPSFPENQFDLILCSYSLSMIPELEDTLHHIRKQLMPGGYLLAVDFDKTPFPWFEKWMKTNFVDFSSKLFGKLKDYFREETFCTKKAYLGLWEYSLFVGRKEGE